MNPTLNKEVPEARCNMKCTGNRTQTCGGTWANSVYETGVESNSQNSDEISQMVIFSNNNFFSVPTRRRGE